MDSVQKYIECLISEIKTQLIRVNARDIKVNLCDYSGALPIDKVIQSSWNDSIDGKRHFLNTAILSGDAIRSLEFLNYETDRVKRYLNVKVNHELKRARFKIASAGVIA